MDKAHGFYDFNGRYVLLQSGKLYAIIQVQDEAYPYNMQDRMARIDPVSPSIEVIYNKLKWGPDIMHYVMCGGMLVVGYEYPASQDEVVVGYNVLTSTVVWSQTTEIATGEFACNDAEGRVYLPTNPYLYGLEATTGAEVWKYSGFGAIHTPSLANGIIYFTSRTNMVAIDEDTRQQVFSYPLGRTSDGIAQVAIGNGMLAFSNGAYGTIGGDGTDCALYVLGLPDLTYMPVLVRSD
jgi:outer membrane protein assembly factor BamB